MGETNCTLTGLYCNKDGSQPRKLLALEMTAEGTPNPNKWSHNLRAISTQIDIISITIGLQTKNSADLSSGRRPVSKSDEFFVCNPIVIEI